MTLQEIKNSLTPIKDGDVTLFRPIGQFGFIEIDTEILNKAFDELVTRIKLGSASALETVMLQLFMAHERTGMY